MSLYTTVFLGRSGRAAGTMRVRGRHSSWSLRPRRSRRICVDAERCVRDDADQWRCASKNVSVSIDSDVGGKRGHGARRAAHGQPQRDRKTEHQSAGAPAHGHPSNREAQSVCTREPPTTECACWGTGETERRARQSVTEVRPLARDPRDVVALAAGNHGQQLLAAHADGADGAGPHVADDDAQARG